MTNYHAPDYGWPTTRCYPRSMNEAFPNDIDNAQWWYPPQRDATGITMLAGISLWGFVAALFWYST